MLQMITRENQNTRKEYVNFREVDTELKKYLEITIYKTSTCNNKTYKKTVNILQDMEYSFTYYDPERLQKVTITGLVGAFDETSIKVKCLPETPTSVESVSKTFVNGLTNCSCSRATYSANSKYRDMVVYTIPIQNISDIVPTPPDCKPGGEEKKQRKGYKVMLLGMTATTLRAVVINLKVFSDDCDDAVKDINLEIGKVYNVVHWDDKAKAIFEFTGKLVNIIETDKKPIDDTVIRECSCDCSKKEIPGVGMSLYESSDSTKDDFLSSDNIKKDIKLVFDSSETFNGTYESVMLSALRECDYISDGNETHPDTPSGDDDKPEPGPIPEPIPCHPHYPRNIEMMSGATKIDINPITGKVRYSGGPSGDGTVTLQEILDFYFNE